MDLVALEEIKRVKHRYLRAVDLKLWHELADTLTEDAVGDYGTEAAGSQLHLVGREEILTFMRDNLGPGIITTHFAGQPEIDVDGDTATGTWVFEDTVIATEFKTIIRGAAFYEDTYRRGSDGQWRISQTGYTRTYEFMHTFDDLPHFNLTANRWA
ncbi:nuclear transport factor 2 family protein [Saccharopolyspora rhizosphaerae]|uniref:Nuclear transport factor 2 family protein n=1 Tax=Saccharopolyspora rhizosphaerae TaxID=2492662 RepID=A0A3R8R4C4_9PSEU|nr:nuclear transport factor 2 family protein [Saccharopolyspora rhizosphaerae]RRO18009.1 nuclear transport factor 2 family protein [Saccharopolyspora rhizosphaerae]